MSAPLQAELDLAEHRPPAQVSNKPRSGRSMAVTYVLAAIAATALNILAQECTRRFGPYETVTIPMLVGTIVGFAAKYVLDKRVVFDDAYRGPANELRKVVIYANLSVATTLVFWGTELLFAWLWQTTAARYVGAVIGLSIGYTAKFLLDRALVFRDSGA